MKKLCFALCATMIGFASCEKNEMPITNTPEESKIMSGGFYDMTSAYGDRLNGKKLTILSPCEASVLGNNCCILPEVIIKPSVYSSLASASTSSKTNLIKMAARLDADLNSTLESIFSKEQYDLLMSDEVYTTVVLDNTSHLELKVMNFTDNPNTVNAIYIQAVKQ